MAHPIIRPDVAAFLAAAAASGQPGLEEMPVPAARAAFAAIAQALDLDPLPLATVRNLGCPGPGGTIGLRFYDLQENREPGPLILFFHGGGFVLGDLDTHDSFCRTLAARSALPVLAVDYRRAPEHPFPAFVDDAEAAARWVASRPAELGRDVTGLVTCGDSAGGHLAIQVAQCLNSRPACLPVLAQWAIYPFVGGGMDWPSVQRFGEGHMITQATMRWFDSLCGNPFGEPRYTLLRGEVPPVPLVIHTAGLDPLRDQGLAYAAMAEAANAMVVRLEAEGMIHGYVTLRRAMPSAVTDVERFIAAGLAVLAQAGSGIS
jgi:acetyl esterase